MPAIYALGILLFFVYGAAQIYASYLGIEYELGAWWATIAIVLSLMFRSSLLIMIGAFLGAFYVWEWHWFWALAFAAPGLLLIVPGAAVQIFEGLMRRA